MSFFQNIQKPEFWKAFLKIALPFFILLVLITFVLNSGRDILAGDFAAVNEENFANGKWVRFWGIKIAITLIYSLIMTNRNMH